ncbi:MAG: ATP-binding protein [Deltaproteobacteria bacterium]|nr:ATP-binding protein [Deltaproteobacteria bacterium]
MELIIFIGLQAAGKSSFYRARFADTHALVSKDLLRNGRSRQARQLALIERALRRGESVVVDNTNPRIEDRSPLIAIGRALDALIVGYDFKAGLSECLRRNALRQGRDHVPDVAIYATARRLESPHSAEGFDAIFRVQLIKGGFEIERQSFDKEDVSMRQSNAPYCGKTQDIGESFHASSGWAMK